MKRNIVLTLLIVLFVSLLTACQSNENGENSINGGVYETTLHEQVGESVLETNRIHITYEEKLADDADLTDVEVHTNDADLTDVEITDPLLIDSWLDELYKFPLIVSSHRFQSESHEYYTITGYRDQTVTFKLSNQINEFYIRDDSIQRLTNKINELLTANIP